MDIAVIGNTTFKKPESMSNRELETHLVSHHHSYARLVNGLGRTKLRELHARQHGDLPPVRFGQPRRATMVPHDHR